MSANANINPTTQNEKKIGRLKKKKKKNQTNTIDIKVLSQETVFVLPPTGQETKYYSGGREVAHEPRLVSSWTMRVIGSPGAMWTM